MRRLSMALASFILLFAACSNDGSGPADVVESYQEARNARDIDALVALYSDAAVVENHPAADGRVATGVAEIRPLEVDALLVQGSTGKIEFVDISVSSNAASFKDRFHNSNDECFSGSGHEVTVEDGKITRFVWGSEEAPELCP